MTWQKICENPDHLQLHHYIRVGLQWVQKWYSHTADSKVHTIAMGMYTTMCSRYRVYPYWIHSVLNPSYKFRWVKKHWDASESERAKDLIIQTVSDLIWHEMKNRQQICKWLHTASLQSWSQYQRHKWWIPPRQLKACSSHKPMALLLTKMNFPKTPPWNFHQLEMNYKHT